MGRLLFPKVLLFAVLFSIAIVFSCKKKDKKDEDLSPAACLNTNQFVQVDEIVHLSNCSQNYERAEWDFGDASSSTISDPTHAWDKKGVYNISLKVFKGNLSASTSKKIAVGVESYISLKAELTKSTLSSKYTAYGVYASLCKDQVEYWSMGSDNFQVIEPKGTFHSNYGVVNEVANFRIKLVVIGIYEVPSGGGTSQAVDRLDSLFTGGIDVFDGPVNPTGSGSLKGANIAYTINPVFFN